METGAQKLEIDPFHTKIITFLSILIAALTIAVSGFGLRQPDIYRPTTPDHLIAGAIGQDISSMVFAILMIVSLIFIRKGHNKAWLIWLGLLAYITYAYAIYSFEAVYNPYYLIYIAILGFSIFAIILFFSGVEIPRTISNFANPPPRKSVAFLFGVLVLMFLVLWLSIMLPAMQTRIPPVGNTIHVLDLSFVLPLLAIETSLLLRRTSMGDFLAVPLLIKTGSIGVSVLLGSLMAPAFGFPIMWSELPIYLILGLLPLCFVWPYFRRLN